MELIIRRYGIIGTNLTVCDVLERTARMDDSHSTWSSDAQGWLGHVHTRALPPEVDAIPRGEARIAAVRTYYADLEELCYRAIVAVYPEMAEGRRCMGEISLDRRDFGGYPDKTVEVEG